VAETHTSQRGQKDAPILDGHELVSEPYANDQGVAAMWALLLSPLAASAIVLRAAVYLPLSFRTGSHLLLVVALFLGVTLANCTRPRLLGLARMAANADRPALSMALGACMLAGLAATCLHRADADDAIYLPKLVHYLSYPASTVDGSIYEITSSSVLKFPRAATTYYPTSYEFAQGAFALLSGVDLLTVYYVIAPLLAGVIGMLAMLINIRSFGTSFRAASYSAALLVPVILLLGESHRSYGNLSLARAFQSKFAFFLFGLPIFLGVSLAFFRSRDATTWLCLLVVSVALSGMTTSALVMLPMLAIVLLAAWLITVGGHEGWVKLGVTYAMTLVPTLLFALDYRRYAVANVGFGSALNDAFPRDFSGQFGLLEQGDGAPISLVCFGAALLVCLARAKRNAFVLTWSLLAILLYLNPLTAPWIMRFVSSENIYWRLFYLLPFPLIIGIACAKTIDSLPCAVAGCKEGIAVLVLLIACLFISPTSVLREENGMRIGSPGPTLDALATDALGIAKLAPAGVVLAPVAVAQDMAILSAKHVQVATRADFMANAQRGELGENQLRLRAALFISGEGGRMEDMVEVLNRDRPGTVVLARRAVSSDVIHALVEDGLHRAGAVGQWVVYVSRQS
jgi:hypothetical protein